VLVDGDPAEVGAGAEGTPQGRRYPAERNPKRSGGLQRGVALGDGFDQGVSGRGPAPNRGVRAGRGGGVSEATGRMGELAHYYWWDRRCHFGAVHAVLHGTFGRAGASGDRLARRWAPVERPRLRLIGVEP
jgi:hypothetical protein